MCLETKIFDIVSFVSIILTSILYEQHKDEAQGSTWVIELCDHLQLPYFYEWETEEQRLEVSCSRHRAQRGALSRNPGVLILSPVLFLLLL